MSRSPFEESFRASRDLAGVAKLRLEERKHREAADLCHAAAMAQTPAAWRFHNAPQHLASYDSMSNRSDLFALYCYLLIDGAFEATHDDRANLRRIIMDSGEPKIFRVLTARTFAVLQWLQKKREKAAGILRDGVFYCESSGGGADQDAALLLSPDDSQSTRTLEASVDGAVQQMKRMLSVLEGRLTVNDEELARLIWGNTVSPFTTNPRRFNFTHRCKNVPPHLLDRTFVGGRACDACGTPRKSSGSPTSRAARGAGASSTAPASARPGTDRGTPRTAGASATFAATTSSSSTT
jgi:hypothetical protein